MARAAFLMDRLLRWCGLGLVALFFGAHALVVRLRDPRDHGDADDRGAAATGSRRSSSRRFMSCSARIPVYVILIGGVRPGDVPWASGSSTCWRGSSSPGCTPPGDRRRDPPMCSSSSSARCSRATPLVVPRRAAAVPAGPALSRRRAAADGSRGGPSSCARARSSWSRRSSCGRCCPSRSRGRDRAKALLDSSIAGKIASGLEVVVRPIGFNHEIALALVPAMAAREVAVTALATAYSIEATDEAKAEQTAHRSGCGAAGRCRPRSPSSPGSSSRRNAYPQLP